MTDGINLRGAFFGANNFQHEDENLMIYASFVVCPSVHFESLRMRRCAGTAGGGGSGNAGR